MNEKNIKLDILAFGMHPDDVELSCGGTILKHKSLGYKIGICDITRGEMGTRGNAETRDNEAVKAADILGVDIRVNLELQDAWAVENQASTLKIIEVIRRFRPKIILCNAIDDRHPDHKKGSDMVKNAAFLSGLLKIETNFNGELQLPFRPNVLYHYIQQYYIKPDLVVDISDFIDKKMESVMAYSTQFYNPKSDEPMTPISDQKFLDFIRAKDIHMGMNIGARFGEGYTVDRIIGVEDLTKIL